jgi:hypothetical protein
MAAPDCSPAARLTNQSFLDETLAPYWDMSQQENQCFLKNAHFKLVSGHFFSCFSAHNDIN